MSLFTKSALPSLSFLIVISFVFNSCHSKEDRMTDQMVYYDLLKKAKLNIDQHADSSLLYADSAIRVVRSLQIGETALISLYEVKAKAYQSVQKYDSVNVYLELMQSVALANNDSLSLAKGYLLKGELEADNENVYVAEKFLLKSIPILARKGTDADLAKAYTLYGVMLSGKAEYKSAQMQFLKAYELYKRMNDLNGLCAVSLNIANNYMVIGSKKNALVYYKMAYQTAEQIKDTTQQISCLLDLGIYYRLINTDSAMYCYQKALDVLPPRPLTPTHIQVYYNMANLYGTMKQWDKAMKIYTQIYNQCVEMNFQIGIAMVSSGLSSVSAAKGQHDLAEKYILDALKIVKKNGSIKREIALKKQLLETYTEAGKYKEALTLATEIKVKSDSLMDIRKQLSIHEMEIYYQSEKMRLENKNLLKEQANDRLMLLLRLIVIFILSFIVILMFIIFKQKNKIKKQQIIDLEEKNALQAKLKELETQKLDWFKRLVMQQQNEWADISKENESIRVKLENIDLINLDGTNKVDVSTSKTGNQQHYWENLTVRFNIIYPAFIDKLIAKHPSFSKSDIQFCMLIKLNISLKDIASIMNINVESIYKRKYRMEEKMQMKGSDLYKTIQDIS